MWVGGKTNYATGGSVTPNRRDAYKAASKKAPPPPASSADFILALPADEFVGALEELQLPDTERQFLETAYFELNRALPMTERPEGRRVGNIAPISTPEGMTGAEALMSGDWELTTPEFVRGMYEGPAEAANVVSAMGKGVPLSKQKLGEAATTTAGIATLAGPPTKALQNKVDRAQRAQYDRFVARNTPDNEISRAENAQFYYPSELEGQMMDVNASPDEQIYLNARKQATEMLKRGVGTETVLDLTGMLAVPLKTPDGRDFGTRLMAALPPADMEALRPERSSNYNIPIVDEKLGRYTAGYFEGELGFDAKIGLNERLSPDQRQRTLEHELTHADLAFSQLDPRGAELGASPEAMANNKADYLDFFDKEIKRAPDKATKDHYKGLREKLRKTTAYELYQLNPGEMLARLSEGDSSMAVRLSPTETLNPYIRPKRGPITRGLESLTTALSSETSPVISKLLQRYPQYTNTISADYYGHVPTDMSKALVTDPFYLPRNPAPK